MWFVAALISKFQQADDLYECTDPWLWPYWLDYINFYFLFLMTLPCTVSSVVILFCGKCLKTRHFSGRYYRAPSSAEESQQTMQDLVYKSALMHKQFSELESQSTTECVICMVGYEPADDVVVLPCNIGHYFHAECIEQWLKNKSQCPLCRKHINAHELRQQQRNQL